MAIKQVPLGQGMVKQAAGAWGYEPNLPNTATSAANSKCSDDYSTNPQAPPS